MISIKGHIKSWKKQMFSVWDRRLPKDDCNTAWRDATQNDITKRNATEHNTIFSEWRR